MASWLQCTESLGTIMLAHWTEGVSERIIFVSQGQPVHFYLNIYLYQLQRRHRQAGRGDAIEELKSAFESAEKSSPGVTDAFIRDLFTKLLPNMTEAKVRQAQDNLMR